VSVYPPIPNVHRFVGILESRLMSPLVVILILVLSDLLVLVGA
jgi:hypothetical protein